MLRLVTLTKGVNMDIEYRISELIMEYRVVVGIDPKYLILDDLTYQKLEKKLEFVTGKMPGVTTNTVMYHNLIICTPVDCNGELIDVA